MGISFDRETRIAGYRPATFKNGLSGYLRTYDPGRLIDLTSLFPLRRDGAIMFEECLDRGLIDPDTLKVTDQGMVMVRAKVVARTPNAKARAALERFLDRVDALNRDPEAMSRVDEVWLFGSLMREEPNVGDIDLAIARSSDPRFKDLDDRVKHARKLIAIYPEAPQSWTFPWDRIDWLYRRAIFGPRREPLLAGVQDGLTDLASLGVPCRLIYDRARGGRVDDPILPRHPSSPGRSNEVDPLPEMPDLTPATLRPMDARWLTGYDNRGRVSPYDIYRGWTDDCHKLFPDYPEHLRIATDSADLSRFPWLPRSLKQKGLDGRSAVAIMSATDYWGTCITLHRAFAGTEQAPTLEARFSDLLLHRSRKNVDLATLPEMAAATALILAVDAERCLRRQIESGTAPHLTIRILNGTLPDTMRNYFVTELASLLETRAVAIEPARIRSSVRIELA
ncbi:nucleotidyltransferase domain-containing protein [Sphingobium sp. SA916]|uniref:nucleotidyltransferase domain-containing protein n=1 Tax=Sphingobium sp. SA916 TaxID=1851207 RepID=UPI000C9FF48A|nr:nucleotidyltransferase domain-containing protein [Sphingobium sp. SA916]PNQ04027.1 hypothetical protein A8G00_09110 [Sphingobium sp. SA916]